MFRDVFCHVVSWVDDCLEKMRGFRNFIAFEDEVRVVMCSVC